MLGCMTFVSETSTIRGDPLRYTVGYTIVYLTRVSEKSAVSVHLRYMIGYAVLYLTRVSDWPPIKMLPFYIRPSTQLVYLNYVSCRVLSGLVAE